MGYRTITTLNRTDFATTPKTRYRAQDLDHDMDMSKIKKLKEFEVEKNISIIITDFRTWLRHLLTQSNSSYDLSFSDSLQ